jgi:Tol biopolymer transport system component
MTVAAAVVMGLLYLTIPTQPASAAFQGENGRIAFVRGTQANQPEGEIYVMDPDGDRQVRLTTNSWFDGLPSFSPDGDKIAFTSRSTSTGGVDEIWAVAPVDVDANGEGDNLTQITGNPPDPVHNFQSAFSPDGKKMAFVSARDGNNEIYVMNPDGTQTRLTNNTIVDSRPVFSPDGQRIAFSRRDGPTGTDPNTRADDIYVMNADGTGTPIRLTSGRASDTHANFAPDGGRIAFTSNRDGDFEIYTMDAADPDGDGNGENLTKITDNSTVLVNNANVPVTDEFPAFSPDGRKLAFSSNRDGNFEIYTMEAAPEDPTDNKPVRLTNTPEPDSKPDWGPSFYHFGGFYQPVDNAPTTNLVKAGAAVPVKFGLGGDQGLDVIAAGYPKSQQIDCDSEALIDSIEQTATAGDSVLSYDATTGRYVYAWKTGKAWSDTCREFVMKLDDGTVHRATFEFK